MRRAPLLLLPALLTLGCGAPPSLLPNSPSPVAAATGPTATSYTLEGTVSTRGQAGSRPIAGARITVDTGTGLFEATTDAQGRFCLTGLPAVLCEITVTKEGFAPVHTSAQLSQDTVLNVELRGM